MSDGQRKVLAPVDSRGQPVTIGRYVLHRQIARGGMATIHIARLLGDEGFSRIVAAKRLHPEFAEDAEFVAMFLDEARVASKVRHRNVVPVLDVVTAGEEVILVQEYVHGVPLHWLLRTLHQGKAHVPIPIAVAFGCQVLAGLHAAHEAVDELGTPLQIVHRDVSPQNVLIALDGSARLLDFGVAKAIMAAHITREGTYKGKLAYSAPEQLRGAATRQSDIYSLSVLLWELIVGHRMHRTAQNGAELVATIMNGTLPTICEALESERAAGAIGEAEWRQIQVIDPIVKKGLAVETRDRWATALEMEEALALAVRPATPSVASAWVRNVGKEYLDARDWLIASEEASWRKGPLEGGRRSSVTRTSSINLRVFAESGVEARGHHDLGARGPGERSDGMAADLDANASLSSMFTRAEAQQKLGPFAMGVAASALLATCAALGTVLFLRLSSGDVRHAAPGASRAVPALPSAVSSPPAGAQTQAPHTGPGSEVEARGSARERNEVEARGSARERNDGLESGEGAGASRVQLDIGETTIEGASRASGRPAPPRAKPEPRARPSVEPRGSGRERTDVDARGSGRERTEVDAHGSGRERSDGARPAAVAAPVASPPASSAPANGCNPPYYFEGKKKIFKTACL